MRKLRILLAEVIGLGLLIGWLLWKTPELIERIIPWVALGVAWHITWEYGLNTKICRNTAVALGKRVHRMWLWIIVFLIGGSISLLYWAGINKALNGLAPLAAQRVETKNQTQDETKQLPPDATTPADKPITPVTSTPDTVNPLGNLVRLGWGVKDDAKNLATFEINNK